MFQIDIEVSFNSSRKTHATLVSELSPAFKAQSGDTVDFQIDFNKRSLVVYADLLILVASIVSYLNQKGVKVTGTIHCEPNDDKILYASRVNFFQLIGLPFEEKFQRKPSIGRLTELTPYNAETFTPVADNLRKVVIANIAVDIQVQALLDYCLSEIMDNVLRHSDYPNIDCGKGMVCAQLFQSNKEIRLMICDAGVGIHEALTKSERSKYKDLTEEEALNKCIERGVTNGEGLGFGLFATSEFIRLNKGEMVLYSGNTFIRIINGKITTQKGNFWQGTFVFMRIKTNIPVDYKQIMPDNHNIIDDYKEIYLPKAFGIDDNLW